MDAIIEHKKTMIEAPILLNANISDMISCHYPNNFLNAMSIDLLFLLLTRKSTEPDHFNLQALSIHQDQLPSLFELGDR